jgi:HAE1 family hydrophobic/amphiphilic exporter-1
MRIWAFVMLFLAATVLPAHGRVLTLDVALSLALENNDEMRLADQDRLRAREEIREGWAEALPDIRLTSNYDRSWILPTFVFDTPDGQQTFTIGTSNSITSVLSFRQPIYSSGRVGAALRAARAFEGFAQEGYKLSRQAVASRTEIGFYDTMLAGSLVQVTSEALRLAAANLAQVTSLRRAGRVSDYDLFRAQVQVSELRPDSIQAAKTLELARTNLRDIIGVEQSEDLVLSGAFRSQIDPDLLDLEKATMIGMRSRPEVHQAALEVKIRAAAVQVQKAELRPSLSFVASGQLAMQSSDLRFLSDETQESWVTGLSLSIPLFDGLRNRALVNKAKVDRRKAEIQIDQLNKQVRLDIRQAWFDVKESTERAAAQAQVVTQAEKGERIARSRYGNGVGIQLEVLDAQLVLSRSKSNLVRAERDRAVSMVLLERAVGVKKD